MESEPVAGEASVGEHEAAPACVADRASEANGQRVIDVRGKLHHDRPIDPQRLVASEAKEARMLLPGLCEGRDRTDLSEAQAQGRPAAEREPVLVKARPQADPIAERQPGHFEDRARGGSPAGDSEKPASDAT